MKSTKAREIQILERILCSPKSSHEKRLLAMIGLMSMARRETMRTKWEG